VVHEGERFSYEHGTDPFLRHVPDDQYEDMPITHVYAVVHYTNGGFDFEVMSNATVEKIRARSKAPDSPAWKKDWGEMAKAKVIRRLAKRLPVSAQNSAIVKAAALDEATDAGILQDNAKLIESDEQGNANVPPPEKAIGHNESMSEKASSKLDNIAQQFDAQKPEGARGVQTATDRPSQGSERQGRPSPNSPSPNASTGPTGRDSASRKSPAAESDGLPINFR